MNPTEFIVKRFNVDPRYSNYVPVGWTGLFFETLEKIKQIDPNVKFIQIKEKFACLTVYFLSDKRDEINLVLKEAEKQSVETCQICGYPGKVETVVHYMSTLCATCYKTQIQNRKTNE